MLTDTYFAAVRLDTYTGEEWISTTTISVLAYKSRLIADGSDKQAPEWATANSIVRIGKIEIKEIT